VVARYKRNTNLPSEIVGGEIVFLDAGNDLFLSSNEVGALVWSELEHPRSLDELCLKVIDVFDGAERSVVEADLTEFLAALLEKNLVRKLL